MTSILLRLNGLLLPLVASLALLPVTLPAASQIHVSPTGDDANPGSAALPVATPQRARDLVRGLITAGLGDAVEVVFAAGIYVMDAPLELRPEDSGTAAFPITWKAATGATVILSGGKNLTGTWTNAGDGTWYLDLPGIGLGAGQWNFRQLFVNGSRATRARFPNRSASNPYLYATGGALDHAIIAPALVKPAWGSAADAQINIVPQSRFFNQWNTITAVNTTSGRIDLANSERHRTINSGSWFWVEGVRAELDEPGEWFLDTTTGRLHYMPETGVDPNTLEFIAPYLNRIVNVKGDVNAGTHVAHVHFDGLEFRHTTFTLGHIEARVHTDTVVMFENTNDSSVKNCKFENIGGYALWLHLDSQRNVFDRNSVRHSGGGGVLMTGARLAYMDDTKIYTPGEAAAKVFPILNQVTRNTVEHCGKIRYYGGGVHMDSRPFSMSMSPGNRVANNHFNDLSRNGVFAFRNQGGNVVEYNRIHNAMQTTIDGGCIHFATMNHLNAPNFIQNNWLYDIWGYEQKPDGNVTRRLANGVFLDWDTSNTTVRDNWIYNSVGGSVKTIWDNWNLVVADNPSSATPITPPFVADVGPAGTATNGIDLPNNKLTGSVIHYTQSENFSTTGTWTEATAIGIVGLFEFKFLVGTAAAPSQAIYTLPITETGKYQISLLYKPGSDRASNVPIAIQHAGGTANVTWNMRQGNSNGFAVEVGTWNFNAGGTHTVTLNTVGTDGKVIADAVAFVKVADNIAPTATGVSITGSTAIGGTLTGNYTYGDADGDAQGATQFQWFRNNEAEFTGSETAIPGATSQTYQVTTVDAGKHLVFRVTPVALTGVSTGNQVSSESVPISLTAKFIQNLASGTAQKIVLYGTSLTANGAWVSQLQTAVQGYYPGLATWVNSGGSGNASDWGLANLQTKVLDHNPDAVFIEFSMNDAATTLGISRAQAVANLDAMVDAILAARPNCEIILQLMNPRDFQPGDSFDPRVDLELYQQDCRDYASANGLQYIDHMPAWRALLDKGSPAYRVHVPDGVHPNADGYSLFMTPVLLHALGLQATVIPPNPDIIIDNSDLAPAFATTGTWTTSTYAGAAPNTPNNGDSLHDGDTAKGTKTAVFTPVIPVAGTYPVSLRWVSASNRATNVPVTVNFNGGSQSFTINQRLSGGTWFSLGSFPFAAGSTGNVTIETTGTNGFVNVDAMSVSTAITPAATPEVRLRMNNRRLAEPGTAAGQPRASTITAWLDQPATQPVTLLLDTTGGTATSGSDYLALPATLTIPAGKSSTSIDLIPLYDGEVEPEEGFQIKVLPHASYTLGSPTEANVIIEASAAAPDGALLLEEDFGGSSSAPLNGTGADIFDAALINAGGSATWLAGSAFNADGSVTANTAQSSASLNLGTYINSRKGQPDGKFVLSASISESTGAWISLGFSQSNTPSISQNFTVASGVGNIIYRAQNGSPAGEFDFFPILNTNPIDGPDGNTGTRSLSVTLDLTPSGGYNGTSNHGTVTWSDSVLGNLASHTYTANVNFGSVLLSEANSSAGSVSAITLRQILPPANTFATWIGGFGLDLADQDFNDDPDADGLANGIEHVFGSNPNSRSVGITEVSATASSLTFRHPLNPNLAGNVDYDYQWSTNLVDWLPGGQTNSAGTRVTVTSSPPDTNDMSTVVLAITEGPAARLFGRISAQKTP
jgi:lysophospholipase L1-like esterase